MKNTGLKIKFLLLFGLGTVFTTVAQQEAQYSQYMYNTNIINPAYAGSRDVLSAGGFFRSQWMGLEGAPQTGAITMNAPVSDQIGLGATIMNDRVGPENQTNFSADFSYNIIVGAYARLYFGVKATANILNVDYNKLNIENTDPKYQYNLNQFSPNVGVGAYLQEEKWYVGLSVPYMLSTNHFEEYEASDLERRYHAYLMGGYVFDLSYNVQFKPAMLTKFVAGAPLQVDLSANFLFNEKLTLGAAYRWNAAISGMAGFQVTPGMMVGYAYDFDTNKLGNFNSGSHEVFLRFDLFNGRKPVFNGRFF